MISAIATVRRVSLEVIILCVLFSPMKKIEPFCGFVGFISGGVIQNLLKYDVSDAAVIFDEYIPLDSH